MLLAGAFTVLRAVGIAQGAGEALVCGIARPSCSGVYLEQDGDAVHGAAGDLGRGTPEFSHSDTTACRRS